MTNRVGIGRALTHVSVKSIFQVVLRCWCLVLLLPVLVLAGSPGADGPDIFAASHSAIEARMVDILARSALPDSPSAGTTPQSAAEAADSANTAKTADPGNNEVREYANRYWRGREDDLRRALDRLGRIRPALEGILESEGLPKSLAAVVLVESAANPLAVSPKEARGLWQIIPATARQYGLTVDWQRDDRIHTERATRAAARFLHDLHHEFRDWPLALAAYNAGKQAVEKALQRSRGGDFWKISSQRLIPEETRNYVPAVLDAMQLLGGALPPTPKANTDTRSRSDWVYAAAGASD